MKKTQSITGSYLLLAAVSTMLAACGGSGTGIGTGTGTDTGNEAFVIFDFDNDGIEDFADSDADGDGLADSNSNDLFIDLDNDGLDDFSFNNLGEAYAEVIGAEGLASVTEINVCGSVLGTDAFSSTRFWNDNCYVERSINAGGIFADSLYAVAIQRILFCSGFGGAAGQSYDDFADGEYGPLSEAALRAFQASTPNALTDDGIVGRETWAKLEEVLFDTATVQVVTTTTLGSNSRDGYSYLAGPCAGITLFYQDVVADGDFEVLGGWRLAKNAPNQFEAVAFSIEPPFSGRLD